MGLLSKLLPIAGAAAGFAVGGPGGAQIGASLGGAAGGALSKSHASSKATAAQLQAIEDAKKTLGAAYNDVKGYQAPGYSTYQPGVNALTSRLGVRGVTAPAPANALTGGVGYDPATGAPTNPGTGAGVIDMGPGPDGTYAMAPPSAAPANALTDPAGAPSAPSGGVDPGTYGDTTVGGAPAPYQTPQAPGAFHFTLEDYKASPAYQWQQDQARKGILASASATGALQSGAALKELQDRAQQIAYQDYGKERDFAYGMSRDVRGDYNNDRNFGYGQGRDARSDYQDTRNYLTDRFDTGTNDLFRYTGIGQGAANNLSAAASRYGDQIAGLITDSGTARANNALTQGGIGSDLAGDIGGTLGGLATNFLTNPRYGGGTAYGQPGAAPFQIFG